MLLTDHWLASLADHLLKAKFFIYDAFTAVLYILYASASVIQ